MVGTWSLSSGPAFAWTRWLCPPYQSSLAMTPLRRRGLVCAEEGADLPHRKRNPLLRLLPREHAHLRVWRQHRGLDRNRIRMSRDVVGQDQHRRSAVANKIARHREYEVGIGAIHP